MDFCSGVGLENTWIAKEERPGRRLLDVFLQMGPAPVPRYQALFVLGIHLALRT
jgi:hypothetical protein